MMNDLQQIYAPPRDPALEVGEGGAVLPGARVALYTPNQVSLATFLGSAFGGGILLAINESRLGRNSAAWKVVVFSALGTATLVGITFALPAHFPAFPLAIAPVVAIRALATKRQQALVSAHLAAGGKSASSWAVAGIGLASLVAIMVPVFAIAFIWAVMQG